MYSINPFHVSYRRPTDWNVNPDRPGVQPLGCDSPAPSQPAPDVVLYRQEKPHGGTASLRPEQAGEAPVCHYQTVSGISLAVARGAEHLAYQAVLPAGGGLLPFPVVITQVDGEIPLVEAHRLGEPDGSLLAHRSLGGVKVALNDKLEAEFRPETQEYSLTRQTPGPDPLSGIYYAGQSVHNAGKYHTRTPLKVTVAADGTRLVEADMLQILGEKEPDHELRVQLDSKGRASAVARNHNSANPIICDTPMNVESVAGGFLLAPQRGPWGRLREALGLQPPLPPEVEIQGFERYCDQELLE